MKYCFAFLLLVFSQMIISAQPTNNDCSGVIDLGGAPACPEDIYSNVDATPFDIDFENEPGCFAENPPQNDVWFSFVANSDITDYKFTITGVADNGNPITNIQVAVYRGFCIPNGLTLSGCGVGNAGETSLEFEINGLTPNETYYIRVDNYGGDENEGEFKVCVDEGTNEVNIDSGSSNACSGILYDSGGPDGNYSDNENFTFTICPDEIHQCIIFNLEYFNLEAGDFFAPGDEMIFYNGPDTNAPVISTLGDSENNFGAYGGSGVCHTVRADDCLTIQFTSSDMMNFEGFKGAWECSLLTCQELETISVTENATIEQIEQAISSPLADVTVTAINCPEGSFGTFTADQSDLGMEKGLILTSGTPENAVGPNSDTGISVGHNAPGDADLDELSNLFGDGSLSNDACIIEVDVIAFTDELKFEYIFGSEEYPEFVGSINDIFALLISGPGITGIPEINNQENLAVLPNGSGTLIEINSVNNIDNWEYYRNNGEGQSIEYDGLTSDYLGVKKSLTARASVTPCETYKLKFAVADRSDDILDSGVFISDITSGVPTIAVEFASGLDYFIEKCTGDQDLLTITLEEANEEDLSYTVEHTGTATLDVDYTSGIPNPLVIPAGTTEISFPIIPIDDNLVEGTETIIISLVNDFGCGEIPVTTIEAELRDRVEVQVEAGQDVVFACLDGEFQLNATGATDYTWTPVQFVSDPFISNPFVTTDESREYIVVGSVQGLSDPACIGTDTIFVEIVDPAIEIMTDDPLTFCVGDSISLNASNNVGDSNITWMPETGINNPDSSEVVITPPFATDWTYVVSVELAGCTASDTITLNVDSYDFPNVLVQDSTICQGESILLADTIFFTNSTYEWTPDDYLSDANIAAAIATPEEDISYQLISTSENAVCADTFEVNFTVIPNSVEINAMDTVFLCKGDSITLNSTSTSAGMGLSWSPAEMISTPDLTGNSVTVLPEVSGYVYLGLEFNSCSDLDSVWVQVDSLPVLAIEPIPARPDYCKGEVIALVSPGYDPLLYPNINHFWSPDTGVNDYEENFMNLNIAITATETTSYVRETSNGACFESNEIEIIVKDPSITITGVDTILPCPGKEVELTANFSNSDVEDIQWIPSAGIQCLGDCDQAVESFVVFQSGQVTVQAEVDGCPVFASFNIDIIPGTPISITGTDPFCPDQSSTFMVTSDLEFNQTEWLINDTPIDCDNCVEVTTNVPAGNNTIYTTVTYLDGCMMNDSLEIVTFNPDTIWISTTPQIDQDENYAIFQEITIQGNSNNPVAVAEYNWTINGEPLNQNVQSFDYLLENEEECFTLEIVYVNGCSKTNTFCIYPEIPRFVFPNVFIPGGQADSTNILNKTFSYLVALGDVYIDDYEFYEVETFSVFNRWGQKVFDCTDVECAEKGWDGTYNDTRLQGDVYVFVFKARLSNGYEFDLIKGDVTLLR